MPELKWRVTGDSPDVMRKVRYSIRKLQLTVLEHNLTRALPEIQVEWDVYQICVLLTMEKSFIELTGLHEGWKPEDFRRFEEQTIRTLKVYL